MIVAQPPIEAASLGMADSLILMVLALVVFGPRRLPQIGRQIGKLMYEFRKASNDFKFQMEEELRNAEEADRRKREEAERALALTAQAAGAETTQAATEPTAGETIDTTASSYPYGYEDAPASNAVENANLEQPAAEPEPAAAASAAETPAAAAAPSIQPPSTGERVEAERPGSASGAGAQAHGEAGAADSPAKEPAAHHG